MLKLIVEPRMIISWKDFLEKPDYSIALDGYVYGPTRFDPVGPHLNLNHHEQVDRLSTRSTSAQVIIMVKQGLFKRFTTNGEPEANVFVNDPDYDTAFAVWLLRNYERIAGVRSEPLINRLAYAVDMLDATAGSFPLDPQSNLYKEVAWLFQPYTEARLSGHLTSMNAGEMESVIDAICSRIDAYTLGKGERRQLDTRYERLAEGDGWTMVREIGADAKTKLFVDGIFAFVAVRIRESDGAYIYSIGRTSPFVDFPLDFIYKALNKAEGIAEKEKDKWGGGNTIGGSPRERGSRLLPEELVKVINKAIRAYRSRS